MTINLKDLISKADQLFSAIERTNNEAQWDEITEYMLNNQHGIFRETTATSIDISQAVSTSAGSKRTRRLYDSTALQAVQDLASAFQGTLTNPATVWSRLRFQEDSLNDDEEAVAWLELVNQKIHNKLNESNFNTEIAKAYQSFVALANMAIFHESNDSGGFQFTALHIGQIAWSEDKNGMVDTVYRRFQMTARQAVEKWGTAVHGNILKAAAKDPESQFQFLHCIFPRDPKDVKLNELGLAEGPKRPIASIYLDTTHLKVLEEGGYYEMPVLVARWSLMPNERYGRGPSHLAMPDTKSLNKLKELTLKAIAKQIDPPILVNQRDVFGQLDMRPATLSIVKDHRGIAPMQIAARNDVAQLTVQELRDSIKSIFFLDKLLLPPRTETGEMTAFEVSQRIEQMQRVLGPTLSRLNHELLNPLVVRAFKLLLRSNELPPAPQILVEQGVDVEIVFVNQLARAQQIQDVSTIQQWVQGLAGLAQLNPEVVDNINIDGVARYTAKILGVPEDAVQDSKTVQQLREQRAQAAQQQQALEAGVKVADIGAKLPE